MKSLRSLLFLTLLAPLAHRAAADGVVADPGTLAGLLGGSAYTETFEAFTPTAGDATSATNVSSLDSTTVVTGLANAPASTEGPNLVGPGATYINETGSGTSEAQWDGAGYFGATSTEFLYGETAVTTNTMGIAFSSPTSAFGVDVRDFSNYSATLTISVYAANGTTLLYSSGPLALTGTSQFFGYQASAGIGLVTLTDSGSSDTWTPIIDNVTFSPIPEPSTFALLGLGLVAVSAAWQFKRSARSAA